jgi:hypothetical protein
VKGRVAVLSRVPFREPPKMGMGFRLRKSGIGTRTAFYLSDVSGQRAHPRLSSDATLHRTSKAIGLMM